MGTGGNYTQFVVGQPAVGVPVGVVPGAIPTGGATQGKGAVPVSTPATTKPTPAAQPQSANEAKTEASIPPAPTKTDEKAKEEGEIIERPINEILHGRNPITFCNDQSKIRNLHMEWEQVSETGPPHDKTFTWSLKMGEMLTMLGSANSKKAAQNKAAEEMVKKLDQLPKLHHNKRNFNQAFGGPPFMMRGGGNMRGGGRGGFYGNMPPPPTYNKKPKKPEKPEKPEDPNKPLDPAQNNPISKLYEYVKRRKFPEPVFEVVAEEILETRKTNAGFTYKKTKFTMQGEVMGKKFLGESINKKTAKFNSAGASRAEIGAGVGQAQIDTLLQSGRQAAGAASTG